MWRVECLGVNGYFEPQVFLDLAMNKDNHVTDELIEFEK